MFCPECGIEISAASKFCIKCGSKIADYVIPMEKVASKDQDSNSPRHLITNNPSQEKPALSPSATKYPFDWPKVLALTFFAFLLGAGAPKHADLEDKIIINLAVGLMLMVATIVVYGLYRNFNRRPITLSAIEKELDRADMTIAITIMIAALAELAIPFIKGVELSAANIVASVVLSILGLAYLGKSKPSRFIPICIIGLMLATMIFNANTGIYMLLLSSSFHASLLAQIAHRRRDKLIAVAVSEGVFPKKSEIQIAGIKHNRQ